MVDQDAVNLVREALASGRKPDEVVALMKQAGYTDQAISEVMNAVKPSAPADDLARRIAEKNNLPRLGPEQFPSQRSSQQMQNPMPAPGNLDKSIVGLFKLSINSAIHPKDTALQLKGNVSLGDGLKLLAILAVVYAAVMMVISMISAMLVPSTGLLQVSMTGIILSGVLGMVIAPMSVVIGYIIGSGIMWLCAKIVGGKSSYDSFAGSFALASAGLFILGLAVCLVLLPLIMFTMPSVAGASVLNLVALVMQALMVLAIVAVVLFALWIYSIYVYVIFIRETMELSTLRALVAYFMPVIALALVTILVVMMVGSFTGLTGSSTGLGGSASSADIEVCRFAASNCETRLAIEMYSDSSECLPLCTQFCTTSSGQEVIENAIEYCMQGRTDLIS